MEMQLTIEVLVRNKPSGADDAEEVYVSRDVRICWPKKKELDTTKTLAMLVDKVTEAAKEVAEKCVGCTEEEIGKLIGPSWDLGVPDPERLPEDMGQTE